MEKAKNRNLNTRDLSKENTQALTSMKQDFAPEVVDTPLPVPQREFETPKRTGDTPRSVSQREFAPPRRTGDTPRSVSQREFEPSKGVVDTPRSVSQRELAPPKRVVDTPRPELQRDFGQPKRVVDTPRPVPQWDSGLSNGLARNEPVPYVQHDTQRALSTSIPRRDQKDAQIVRERCRQLCISTFFRETEPVRSLGFTSPTNESGKSFLSRVTAGILANDSKDPVVLVDCNWETPDLHKYFGVPLEPGLADWLRGTCKEENIRHKVGPNLTFIPAGNGMRDIVKLLQKVRNHDLQTMLSHADELFVVDLPPIASSGYGRLAASLVQSIFVVVQAGETTNASIAETYAQLKDLPVEGMILNQMKSRIPRWIRELL